MIFMNFLKHVVDNPGPRKMAGIFFVLNTWGLQFRNRDIISISKMSSK